MNDLFPETIGAAKVDGEATTWEGATTNDHGYPLLGVTLLPCWFADGAAPGWHCGWLIRLVNALDEWTPLAPNEWRRHAQYPWHRPDHMPTSTSKTIAMASAIREAKIVIAQMLPYVPLELHPEAQAISEQMEAQALAWLCE